MAVSISPTLGQSVYYTADLRQLKIISSTSQTVTIIVRAKYSTVAYTSIFNATYSLNNNSVTIYDLAEIIEQYIESRNLTKLARVKIELLGNTAGDSATYEFSVIYSKRKLSEVAHKYIYSHLLTTALSRFTSWYNFYECIFYYSPATVVNVETKVTVREQDGTIKTYNSNNTWNCVANEINQFDCSLFYLIDETVFAFPRNTTVLSYSHKINDRIARFFVSENQRSLIFCFRNRFFLPEYVSISIKTIEHTTTKQTLAQCGTQLLAYDVEHTKEYECETEGLTLDNAHWLTEMMTSNSVAIIDSAGGQRRIIITEYTSELSDEPGTDNHLKFKFRFADLYDDADDIFFEQFNKIFTKPYQEEYQ